MHNFIIIFFMLILPYCYCDFTSHINISEFNIGNFREMCVQRDIYQCFAWINHFNEHPFQELMNNLHEGLEKHFNDFKRVIDSNKEVVQKEKIQIELLKNDTSALRGTCEVKRIQVLINIQASFFTNEKSERLVTFFTDYINELIDAYYEYKRILDRYGEYIEEFSKIEDELVLMDELVRSRLPNLSEENTIDLTTIEIKKQANYWIRMQKSLEFMRNINAGLHKLKLPSFPMPNIPT